MPGFDQARAGEPFQFSATLYNKLLQIVQAGPNPSGIPATFGGSQTVAKVRNDSGSAVDRFGVLGLNGPLVTPTANLGKFQTQPTFAGITPVTLTHAGKFCVTLEPIAIGGIGNAVVSGVTIAKLSVGSALHPYCDPTTSATLLTSSYAGSAQILYAESTGTTWGIVRLGNVTKQQNIRGKFDADLTAGSSQTFSIWDATSDTGVNVTVYDDLLDTGEVVPAGVFAHCSWYEAASRYYWDVCAHDYNCQQVVTDISVTCVDGEIVVTKTTKYLRGYFAASDTVCS